MFGTLTNARDRRILLDNELVAASPATVSEAEQIQDAVLQGLDGSIAGWKLGATTHGSRSALGLERAFWGALGADDLLRTGVAFPVAEMSFGLLELELAAILGPSVGALPREATRDDIMQAVAGYCAVFEIPHTRLDGLPPSAGPLAMIADNGSAGAAVLGPVRNGAQLPSVLRASVQSAGALLQSGESGALVKAPESLLADFANNTRARGYGLRPGQVVCLGGLFPPITVCKGATYEGWIEGIGTVKCTVTA